MPKGLFKGTRTGQLIGLQRGIEPGQRAGLSSNERNLNRNFLKVGILGHSIADSAATEKVPIKKGTLSMWINNAVTEITGQSYANDQPALNEYSGFLQHFAPKYKAAFNRPVYAVSGAKGGSAFFTSTFSWYTDGTLYDSFKAKARAGLAAIGANQFDVLFLDLGVNDLTVGTTYANYTTAMTSLHTRIAADFPGVPVLVSQVVRYATETSTQDLIDMREFNMQIANTFPDVHMVGNNPSLAVNGGIRSDGVHKNAYGYSLEAQQYVNWFKYSNLSKWGRCATAWHYDDIGIERAQRVDTFMASQIANANYMKLNCLHIFKTTDVKNTEIDWSGLGFGAIRTATFIPNVGISTDGATTRYDTTYSPSRYIRRATVSDVMAGIKIDVATAVANSAVFGAISTGPRVLQMGIGASFTNYRTHDNTLSSGAEASFAAGNWYSVARNGTTKLLVKNSTTNASVVQANTGLVIDHAVRIGCTNNAGTNANHYQGTFSAFFSSSYSTFDLASFTTALNTMLAGW